MSLREHTDLAYAMNTISLHSQFVDDLDEVISIPPTVYFILKFYFSFLYRYNIPVILLVMFDISKKYRFRDNFVDIIIVSIFDTALADFDIY